MRLDWNAAPLVVILTAILAIVWWYPQFPTTDGPSHVYNAEIVRQYIVGRGPQLLFFDVSLRPFPNWSAHTLLICFLSAFSPTTAERLLVSVYFVAWAAAVRLYLRSTGNWTASAGALAMLLAINLPLLMGFYNFGLGVIGYLVTLSLAWRGHPRTWVQTWLVAVVLATTYFSHLLPFIASLLVVTWLRLVGPASRPRADLGKLVVAALPGLALLLWYVFHSRTAFIAAELSRQVRPPSAHELNWEALQCLWYGTTTQHRIALAALITWAAMLSSTLWSPPRDQWRSATYDWITIVAMSAALIAASILTRKRYDELFVASRLSLLGLVTGIGALRSPISPVLRMVNGLAVSVLAVASLLAFASYEHRSNEERGAHLAAQEFIGEGRLIAPLV